MDWTYLVLVLPFVLLAMLASARVKSVYRKYAAVCSRRGLTADEAARRVLAAGGVTGVSMDRIQGDLTDHYDPRANAIRLSDSVAGSTSVAAIGVACHEAGHALQYAEGYFPIRLRAAVIPVTNVGSKLAIPLVFVGILLTSVSAVFEYVAYAGVLLFGFCVLFQLLTLPVEFNASRRALRALGGGLLDPDELTGARRVLNAAAMTYVAALAVSVMQLLRLLTLISGSSRRRR